MLDLQLLGPPIITVDGAPVVVDTRKATALLAYLAVSGQPHRRDALAALLWPDADASRAAGALRRTLSTVRSAVGAERLHADRADIALVMDDVSLDVARARQLLDDARGHEHTESEQCTACLDRLGQAVALHRGTFLEGFALRDSPAFDDWQFFTAEELTRELASALERLTDGLAAARRVGDAITHARRRLAIDPLHEPAHRDLIRLYAWNGEHAAAVRQYRECVRVLEQELGVPPLQETTELYEHVLQQRLDAPAAPPTTPEPPVAATALRTLPRTAPFVGRSVEHAAVVDAIAGVSRDGVLVAIEGEAGVGKSRLVEEVLADSGVIDRRVVVARCYEGETALAYGVMVEALRAALEQRGDEWLGALPVPLAVEVGRLLPDVVSRRRELPPPPPLDAPGAATRFVDALGRALVAAVDGEHPGLVVVEDVQWIDDASLETLTHLARRLAGRPIALVLTWRSELVGRGHPLRRLVADVRREQQMAVVTLGRLSADAVAEALSELGVSDDAVATRVFDETEGLPLLVVEYARALVEDPDALDAPLPGGARDVLLARLDAVSDTAAQILATAAVIGRSFHLDVLTEASGRSDDEVTAAVEELLSRRLVAEVSDATAGADVFYDFTHAQLRQLAYDNAALARRRLLHRRVAAALEARGRRAGGDALAGVIAGHWAAAGDDDTAVQWAVRAGAHAASLLAIPQAIAHYRTALALGHPDVAALHERLGDLRTLQGLYAEAVADYESAVASARPSAVAALEHKLGVVHHRVGRWDLAEWHLERALVAMDGGSPPGLRARIVADRGLNAYRQGDVERATQLAEQAAGEAADAGDPANQAQAANLLGLLARARGDLDGSRRHLERSLVLARELGDAAAEMSALNNLALAVGAAGDTEEALRLAGTALERSAAVGDRHREAALHNNVADLLRAQGRNDEAMEHLKQAVTIFADVGEPGVLTPEVFKLVDW